MRDRSSLKNDRHYCVTNTQKADPCKHAENLDFFSRGNFDPDLLTCGDYRGFRDKYGEKRSKSLLFRPTQTGRKTLHILRFRGVDDFL